MTTENLVLTALAIAVVYLLYKVNRLERLVQGQRPGVRRSGRLAQNGKIIPILKEQIEPGPFKQGNRRKRDRGPENE